MLGDDFLFQATWQPKYQRSFRWGSGGEDLLGGRAPTSSDRESQPSGSTVRTDNGRERKYCVSTLAEAGRRPSSVVHLTLEDPNREARTSHPFCRFQVETGGGLAWIGVAARDWGTVRDESSPNCTWHPR